MFEPFYRYASPQQFYLTAKRLVPWLGTLTLLLASIGLYGGLVHAPPDYQQGDAYRIIYIHVPAAWMSLFVYVVMATSGAVVLIWHVKLAEVIASSSAPLGASFTFLALITGSLWGKPMWGTYWVWDARLTSELILLFLYLGFMALETAIEDVRTGGEGVCRAGARRGGKYSDHPLLGGMVEHTPPGPHRVEVRRTLDPFQYAGAVDDYGSSLSRCTTLPFCSSERAAKSSNGNATRVGCANWVPDNGVNRRFFLHGRLCVLRVGLVWHCPGGVGRKFSAAHDPCPPFA